jgi:hypothetical protein
MWKKRGKNLELCFFLSTSVVMLFLNTVCLTVALAFRFHGVAREEFAEGAREDVGHVLGLGVDYG